MSLYPDPIRHARSVESGLHPLPCPADYTDRLLAEIEELALRANAAQDAGDIDERDRLLGEAKDRMDSVAAALEEEDIQHPVAPDMSNAAFDGDRPASENCEEETCPEGCACPTCGENRIDYLPWIPPDYEEVECATCGRIYNPEGPLAHVPAEIAATVLAFERMGERYEAGDAPGYKEA